MHGLTAQRERDVCIDERVVHTRFKQLLALLRRPLLEDDLGPWYVVQPVQARVYMIATRSCEGVS